MMRIKKFNNFMSSINERKNYGDLYHFTTLFNLLMILECNYMSANPIKNEDNRVNKNYPKKYKAYISLTRDKNFIDVTQSYLIECSKSGFCLNGDMLTDHYKIVPHNDYYDGEDEYYSSNLGESEESILLRSVKLDNIKKYIKYIIIPAKKNFREELMGMGEYMLRLAIDRINIQLSMEYDISILDDQNKLGSLYDNIIALVKNHNIPFEIYSK